MDVIVENGKARVLEFQGERKMAFNEEELKEMAQGGRPYSPQQNEVAEARKERPKVVAPKPHNNGEKLYKKCPTCGQFMEVSSTMTQPQLFVQQEPQVINGRIVNQLIQPMPQGVHQSRPDRIVSDEKDVDGTPLVDAHWNEGTEKLPLIPLK